MTDPVPKPEDEAGRLRRLVDCRILDTPPEQAFEDLTMLASAVCDAEIALISLVEENRQWFKSRLGIEASETPREIGFCAHAICAPSELLVVNDARIDARFANNPMVVGEPFIRFYAGAPLVVDGHALGTLCVAGKRSRRILRRQEEMLVRLARIASSLIAARSA